MPQLCHTCERVVDLGSAAGKDQPLAAAAPGHGWRLLFPDTHPYAGGPDHYAAYLASTDGFEVELVAGQSALPHR